MTRKVTDGRIHDYEAVLKFIIAYKQEHDGNSPTLRQIMRSTGISSTSQVSYILRSLQIEGRIYIEPYDTRSIQVIGGCWVPPDQIATGQR